MGGAPSGGSTSGGRTTGGQGSGGTARGGSTSCTPYHYPGSNCASCHSSACTCETQATSCQMGVCASPGTPIATPAGASAIESLRLGDLVYSLHRRQVVAVPVREVRRRPAGLRHSVVRAVLATGSTLEISAPHPTADGRVFGDLRSGDRLGSVEVVDVSRIPYRHEFTYDILPASDSGTYFAGGVPIGSTLSTSPKTLLGSLAWPSIDFSSPQQCQDPETTRWWWEKDGR